MAYVLPLVRVYQQLEQVSPVLVNPELPACVIGRAYQVLTYGADKASILVGSYDVTNGNVFFPPSILPGALLESSSVKVYMDDMLLKITEGTFNAVLNENTLVDAGATFTTDNIDIGDTVVIDHISLSEPLERVVIGIAATTLTLNKNFTAALTGATYVVRKKVDDRLLVNTNYVIDENEITVYPGITHTFETVTYDVIGGSIYCEYKALRTDLSSDVDTVSSTDDIESKVGVINSTNPLALGLSLALSNTTTSVSFIAIDTKEGDELGWARVRDILENNTQVYCLSLLTDKASVIGDFKTHCELMSTADNYGWRVCTGGVPLVTEKVIIEESLVGEIYDNGGTLYFRDNAAEFIAGGVGAGDILEITAPTLVTGSYTINGVLNDNVLDIYPATPLPAVQSGVTYTVTRNLSKQQQAEEIAATIDAYNSKRAIIVWPDQIEVNGELVPGYFQGCLIGGMTAGLPPHQGFTRLGVGGVSRLYHSNTYFNKEQLNKIAEAGGWIFVQDTPNSLPYVRHQVTTDGQFLETREYSLVKNFDHLSYYFFAALKDFIGIYNVTDATLTLVTETIRLAAEAKKKAELPRIGAPLSDYELVSSEVSLSSADKIESKVRLDLPKPLNGIDLFLAI